MIFLAFGVNHKTAPLDMREKFAFTPLQLEEYLNELITTQCVKEAVLLSTCNRTELYCITEHPSRLLPWFAEKKQIPLSTLSPYVYQYQNEEAIRHVLRVASGLDSMMLGEPQILGQLKQSFQDASAQGAVHHQLRSIFQSIFSASKRIRHKSGISNNPISIAYAAVLRIKHYFPKLSAQTILLIGSGETSTLVAKYLHKEGARKFMVASRTEENALKLGEQFQAKSLTITDIATHLPHADVVISATACPLPFISKAMVEQALFIRHQAPMFFLDLAVPRDISPDIATLNHVQLFNIDDLHVTIEQGKHERQKAALLAEQLVEDELADYSKWHRSLRATHAICDYRSQMQSLAQQELQRASQKLHNGHCQFDVLSEFCDRLVNKLVHRPTLGLRQAASDERDELLDLTHYLFNHDQEAYEEIT